MLIFFEWLIFIALTIGVGVILGNMDKHDIQKTNCGYCSCKEYCRVGASVEQKCSDEELKPFVCMDGR